MTFPKITLTFSLIKQQALAWWEQACQSEADRPHTLSQGHSASLELMLRLGMKFRDGAKGQRPTLKPNVKPITPSKIKVLFVTPNLRLSRNWTSDGVDVGEKVLWLELTLKQRMQIWLMPQHGSFHPPPLPSPPLLQSASLGSRAEN